MTPTSSAFPFPLSAGTTRRTLLAGGLALLAGAGSAQAARAKSFAEVWKDPDCGCCHDWVKHLEANGFQVKVNDTGNAAIRGKLGMPAAYGSCHTALIGGYAIEGHVPAADIHRLLKLRPKAVGLSVPGMPVGTPGMDAPVYGGRKDAYQVLLVGADGKASVWQNYPGRAKT